MYLYRITASNASTVYVLARSMPEALDHYHNGGTDESDTEPLGVFRVQDELVLAGLPALTRMHRLNVLLEHDHPPVKLWKIISGLRPSSTFAERGTQLVWDWFRNELFGASDAE